MILKSLENLNEQFSLNFNVNVSNMDQMVEEMKKIVNFYKSQGFLNKVEK